jgi:hypothetical protein
MAPAEALLVDGFCGAFVRDLDGHKIEAMFWDASAERFGLGLKPNRLLAKSVRA